MEKSDPLRQVMLAAVLLTRLPLPRLPDAAFAQGARAVWAYPVVGAGVGALGAATGMVALAVGLPVLAASVLALAAMILITGAMHEDGLADVCDGFWGGFTPERRLEIMRDSQIGTYGVLGLIVVFALRLSAVTALLATQPAALIAAAALSRGMMPAVMAGLDAARRDGLAQSVGRPSLALAVIALAIGDVVAIICLGTPALVGIGMAAAVVLGLALLAKAKIGGQSGDVLGAAQQLSEAAVLLSAAAMLGM
ncbi:adenosylcobinamide-GDP ribazoletransferase [Sulfitobacter sp. HNIBRBA2951]|uniref:adenosylcobinamide-GDP ribazoletransferase n=1 Tax=Sulfitobacter aquimarinus TaxID=3158557 RepID=UPI0032DE8709